MTHLSEDSHFKMRLASGAVALIFIATTFIGVGTILREQAQASSDIKELQVEVVDDRERLFNLVSDIKERLARIESKLDQR